MNEMFILELMITVPEDAVVISKVAWIVSEDRIALCKGAFADRQHEGLDVSEDVLFYVVVV